VQHQVARVASDAPGILMTDDITETKFMLGFLCKLK
jgi:hypothetical protein